MRLFKLLIIPLLLTFGYLVLLSYPYLFSKISYFDSLGFLSAIEEKSEELQKTLSSERRTDQLENHLLKGEKVTSKIRASEDNFGILLFRFAKLADKVSDTVVFRIKKEGEEKWYYEKDYKADQFQPDQYFTFGFPPFKNSKNNTYIFEIESLSGTYKNGTGVSLVEPQVGFVYKYAREDLKNFKILSSFVLKKITYVVRNVNFLQNWQIFAIFSLAIILVLFMEKKKINISGIGRFFLPIKLNLLASSLVIAVAFFVVQAFILFNQFGILSVVDKTSLNFKKTNQQDVHLLRDQKASATFKATEDNMGIILLRLIKFGQGGDSIWFRIKKEGEEKWYHESKFHGDQVKNNQLFPLGFPPIKNSKDNVYSFELESLGGEYGNGIGVIKDEPSAVMYRYSVGDLKDYRTLFSFTYKKILYVLKNINYWPIFALFITSYVLGLFMKKIESNAAKYFMSLRIDLGRIFKAIINTIQSKYFLREKRIVNFAKIINRRFTSAKFYLVVLNTDTKKRVAIGLLIFLLAFAYRFSFTLVNQSNPWIGSYQTTFFYAGLGGQGDYDQFIRAATCAVTTFCSAILGQNFLIEASILGMFYKIFGFTEALKVYLILMLVISSIITVIPYLLLSRKNWISLGGILGSLFLATSDFLTHISLNFPPDNGSLFTFSMFFIVYLLTLNIGTIRWLLFFGLIGTIDALNKALFILNDLVAFALFVPVFFFEKIKVKSASSNELIRSVFRKKNVKILFLASIPLLVFLAIYISWEYLVYIKFSAYYFLRGLLQSGGSSYISYTSLSDSFSGGNVMLGLLYLAVQGIIMIKHLIEYANLQIIFLFPIFLGLVFSIFVKEKVPVKKFIVAFILSIFLIVLLTLIKNDYYKIHEIFNGDYIYSWTEQVYVGIFLLIEIIMLFILNFGYSAMKLSLPIVPYVFILIIMAKNAPFARLHTHVVAWSIILLAFLIEWIMINVKNYSTKARNVLAYSVFILFIFSYLFPKLVIVVDQISTGIVFNRNEIKYLSWVGENLPANAVVLSGGKSDLVAVAENIRRPIIYNTLWSAAVLIKPKEILGVKPTDFNALNVLNINEIPGVSPNDFYIISELSNRDNFKKNRYIILEDDIYIWRDRVTGVSDNVFAPSSKTLLHGDNYSLKVYKYNPVLKKAIYELDIR